MQLLDSITRIRCEATIDRWHVSWISSCAVQVLTAQIIDADAETSALLRDVLADAGCLDIDATSSGAACTEAEEALPAPELAIICVHDSSVMGLQRVAATMREVPVIAVCDERDIDVCFVAGAAQCVTRPLRKRELLGRIRQAMRARSAARRQANRERKMSDAIVALQREKLDLQRMVCVDALTGVANRRHALSLLESEWRRCAREGAPLAIVMLDLDCFHAYNENYGHLGGDTCLQRVADAMVRCLRRPSDFLGRYGGEEFMVVLPNTDAAGAKIVAERVRAAVEALGIPHAGSTCSPVVTVTAGFASGRAIGAQDTAERLLAAADEALLRAKVEGRNRVGGDGPRVRPSRVSAQRWQRYAPVYADPWFADRIPAYLESVQAVLRDIVETARKGDRRSGLPLQRLGHSADELGLVAVAALFRELEVAVRDGEHGAVREVADELLQYVLHVQVIYRRLPDPTNVILAVAQ